MFRLYFQSKRYLRTSVKILNCLQAGNCHFSILWEWQQTEISQFSYIERNGIETILKILESAQVRAEQEVVLGRIMVKWNRQQFRKALNACFSSNAFIYAERL